VPRDPRSVGLPIAQGAARIGLPIMNAEVAGAVAVEPSRLHERPDAPIHLFGRPATHEGQLHI
jgi:hypothetical protein